MYIPIIRIDTIFQIRVQYYNRPPVLRVTAMSLGRLQLSAIQKESVPAKTSFMGLNAVTETAM